MVTCIRDVWRLEEVMDVVFGIGVLVMYTVNLMAALYYGTFKDDCQRGAYHMGWALLMYLIAQGLQ